MATKRIVLARKYAQAYLNCYALQCSLADLGHWQRAQNFWQSQPALLAALTVGQFTPAEAEQLAAQFVRQFQLAASFKNLFLLLLQARRLSLLAPILGALRILYQRQRQQYLFQVQTAVPATELELAPLKSYLQMQLAAKTGPGVAIELQLNLAPALLAGIKASNELFQWDGSLQGRLARLAAKLELAY